MLVMECLFSPSSGQVLIVDLGYDSLVQTLLVKRPRVKYENSCSDLLILTPLPIPLNFRKGEVETQRETSMSEGRIYWLPPNQAWD